MVNLFSCFLVPDCGNNNATVEDVVGKMNTRSLKEILTDYFTELGDKEVQFFYFSKFYEAYTRWNTIKLENGNSMVIETQITLLECDHSAYFRQCTTTKGRLSFQVVKQDFLGLLEQGTSCNVVASIVRASYIKFIIGCSRKIL